MWFNSKGAIYYNAEFSAPWSLRPPPSRVLATVSEVTRWGFESLFLRQNQWDAVTNEARTTL